MRNLNRFLDTLSNFLAARKGLLPIIGLVLIVLNFILQFFPQAGWVVEINLFLHIGMIIALVGILLAWAL